MRTLSEEVFQATQKKAKQTSKLVDRVLTFSRLVSRIMRIPLRTDGGRTQLAVALLTASYDVLEGTHYSAHDKYRFYATFAQGGRLMWKFIPGSVQHQNTTLN